MSAVVPNQGKAIIAKRAVNLSASADLKMKLFTNNITPDDNTVIGDFTECVLTGYAEKTLTGANWVNTAQHVSYPEQSFTFVGAGASTVTIYGYYITDGTGVVFTEKFSDGPYTASVTAVVKVTATLNVLPPA